MPPFDQAFHAFSKPSPLLEFLQAHSTPEWWAAFALAVQAVILFLHWIILRRHAGAVEEHVGIAATQARTAEAMGQALQQQGKIMEKQTKIMDEQFKFQRRLETKSEREKLFDLLMQVVVSIRVLAETLLQAQLPTSTQEVITRLNRDWATLYEVLVPCTQALYTSIYLSDSDRKYFLAYVADAAKLETTGDIHKDIQNLQTFQDNYEDFEPRMFAAAKTPIGI